MKNKSKEKSKKVKKEKENGKGRWTKEEDDLLLQFVKNHGEKWKEFEKNMNGRIGKQCSEHWHNCLNPELNKTKSNKEEDFLIIYFYNEYDSWKAINPIFKDRSKNFLKNRYNIILRSFAKSQMIKEEKENISKIKSKELKKYIPSVLNKMINELNITKEYYENLIGKKKFELSKNFTSEAQLTTNIPETTEIKKKFLNKKRNPEKSQNEILSNEKGNIPLNINENQNLGMKQEINDNDIDNEREFEDFNDVNNDYPLGNNDSDNETSNLIEFPLNN